jgi:hypothetical protein
MASSTTTVPPMMREVDRIESSSGERTTSAGGINVIIVGDEETNANLGGRCAGPQWCLR